MKKIAFMAFAAIVALSAQAEGYQVNTLSARQGGMGHTGVAQHLGAESQYFNPAGLAFMNETFDISASINALKPYAKCKTDGKWYESDNDVCTPLQASAAVSINNRWKVGVAFYTPYGSNINWGMNWPGAEMNQKVKLQAFTLQPTVAWRILPNLSVGAGLTMSWGTVDLYKGLISGATYDIVMKSQSNGMMSWDPAITPASAYLKGSTALSWGANIGVMWDINKEWTLGANFRSTSWLKVDDGTAKVIYADEKAQAGLSPSLNGIHESEFDAKMPMPYVVNIGFAYHPTSRWTITEEVQMTGWHAYKTLDVNFHRPELGGHYDQHIAKDYNNSWAIRLGAEYNLNTALDLRAGLAIDQSPINFAHYNPETPGMTKLEPSVGLTYHLPFGLNVNFAALYVAGLGVDGAQCDYEDLLVKNSAALQAVLGSYEKTFYGDYRVHAFNLALGLSYKF